MMRRFLCRVGAAMLVQAAPVHAQTDTAVRAAAGPPIRRIATASAVSTEPLGGINTVRELPDGRVLVNDVQRRRLLLMDTTMKVVEAVLDSMTEVANAYGTRPGALIPHRGDTTLFIDPASYTMLVIDPAGRVVRVRSVPRMQDMYLLTTPSFGAPASDARGRVVYRMPARPAPPKVAPPPGVPWIPQEPDSAFVVAIDIDTRKLDTLGTMRIPKSSYIVRVTGDRGWMFTNMTNPLPSTDDWAVLPDGAVAFVRGRDYRVEYRALDGTMTSGPKLPYDWQRMTEEDKQRLVDSVKTAQNRQAVRNHVTAMIRWVNTYGKKEYPKNFVVPADYPMQNGLSRDWVLPPGLTFPDRYIYACREGEEAKMVEGAASGAGSPPAGVASSAAGASPPTDRRPPTAANRPPTATPSCIPSPVTLGGGNVPPPPTLREDGVLPTSDLPDYRPPIPTGGAVRADLEGNLWVCTIPVKPVPGTGVVYDVVDRQGELVDRLQLPPAYSLVGFGRGKIVYLQMRDANGVHLARVRLR